MSIQESTHDLQIFVPKVTFEQIPIKNLVSNQEYQRHLSKGHVRRMAENFDIYQINPVKVSRRDGINYVFNGQHTIESVAAVSGSRNTPVWCMVYDDIEYQHEAEIFANQQKFTKALTPYEIFQANIEAGSDKQLIIKELVESYQLTISGSKNVSGTICAVAGLEYIFDKQGFHALDRTLRLAVNSWEGDTNSLGSNMLKGIARLIAAFGDDLKDEQFYERVGSHTSKEVIRNAKERHNGTIGYAEAMLQMYNYRLRYPLKNELLYAKDPSRKPEVEQESFEGAFGLTEGEENMLTTN